MRTSVTAKPSIAASVLAFVLLLAPAPCSGTAAEADALVYRLEIDGQPAGWLHERRVEVADGVGTETRTELRFRRGGVELEMEIESGFLETRDGRPLRAWLRQSLGGAPIETVYEFEGDEVAVTTKQGDRAEVRRLSTPEGEWLTPSGLEETLRERLASGVASFETRVFDPQAGAEPIELEWALVERGRVIDAGGRRFTVSRWRQRNSLMPGLDSLVDLAPDGLLVRSETPILGMTMTATLDVGEGRREAETSAAPELLAPSFLPPDRPILDPRRVRRAVYELELDGDGGGDGLPTAGHQRAETTESGLRVVVDLDRRAAAEEGLDQDPSSYLRPSIYLDHEDPLVRRLLDEALADLGEDAPPARRAEALRAFVHRYLDRKGLDVVLGTAGEVARSRAGDCTEHSVLLSALLRAAGIPSRVVAGLVYVEEFAGAERVFGYHMWSQALVGGRWHDLDPSFVEPFDATHVALATSALDDGATALLELGRVAPWIGRARIRVLEIEH